LVPGTEPRLSDHPGFNQTAITMLEIKNWAVSSALCLAMMGGMTVARGAATFTTLDLATNGGNTALADVAANGADFTGFPFGTQSLLGNVPFNQTGASNQVWNAATAATSYNAPASLIIPVNISNAQGVYTLMNTWWGQDISRGYSLASVTFGFEGGDTHTKSLYGNEDLRDYNYPNGTWPQNINGTTTRNVYANSDGGFVIDRQWFDFSQWGKAGETLTSITFNDTGLTINSPEINWATVDWVNANPYEYASRMVLSGLTIQSGDAGDQVIGAPITVQDGIVTGPSPVPEPGSTMALAGLLAGGMSLRRRK
jgi:hypothetical protein